MISKSLSWIVLAATLMDGILASGGINRATVDMPAWRHVGPVGWAAFSRYADLGRTAMVLYPLEAFSGMILSVAAVFVARRHPSVPGSVAIPVYAAALFTIGGLLLTVKAAPIMLSVRHLGDSPAALARAFNGFEFWGGLRTGSQVLGYFANLWSLVAILRCRAGDRGSVNSQAS
jgi:hypothetical protein